MLEQSLCLSPPTSAVHTHSPLFATIIFLVLMVSQKNHTLWNSTLATFQIKLEPYLAPLTPLSTHLSSPISPTYANSPSTNVSTTHNNTSFLYLLSLRLSRNSFLSTTLLLFHLSTIYSIMATLSRN